MKIYFIRHGETDWNKQLKIQGRINNSLNKTGKMQSIKKSKYFNDLKPTKIIHTSLIRTIQTYTEINNLQEWNITPTIDDHFIERRFGELEGCSVKEFYALKDTIEDVVNYECDTEIQDRIREGLESFSEYSNDEIIFIFTHSHVLKSIMVMADVYSDYEFSLPNLSVLQIEYVNSQINFIDVQ